MSIGLVGRTSGSFCRIRLNGKNKKACLHHRIVGKQPKDHEYGWVEHLTARIIGIPIKRNAQIAASQKTPPINAKKAGVKTKLRDITANIRKAIGR